jgi:polyisoprenoid-binding protein YceI
MTSDVRTNVTASTWRLDPAHSVLEFAVKHLGVATLRGRFTDIEGTIIGDMSEPQNAEVTVTIDAASIDTRNTPRDSHLRSPDFLDVDRYPTITFKSMNIMRSDNNHLMITGLLTLHGATREVRLEATLNGQAIDPIGDEVIGVSATTTINRQDYGLTWNLPLDTGGWMIGDTVRFDLEIEAIRDRH